LNDALFAVFGLGALACAVPAVLARRTLHAALWFVALILCLAAIYGLWGAPLLGALQVMVYAGAVMVLFLFAVMVLDVRGQEREAPVWSVPGAAIAAVLAALVFAVGWAVVRMGPAALAPAAVSGAPDVGDDNVARVARVVFRDYALVFEAVGVLLLTAVVAVMVLAKRDLES
jgi:NADH-quinone oxidoreductase subunit J